MLETIRAEESDLLTPAELYIGLIVLFFIVGLVLVALVRPVPRGSTAVVVRSNGAARTHGPGLVRTLPGLDHTTIVVTTPIRVEPLIARGETSDGVAVVVSASATVQVADPTTLVAGAEDPLQGSAERLERVVRQGIGDCTLRALSVPGAAGLAERVRSLAEESLRGIGVSLTRLDIDTVELLVTTQLMSWADQQSRGICGPRR